MKCEDIAKVWCVLHVFLVSFRPVTLLISALNIIEVISLLINLLVLVGKQGFISEYMKLFHKNSLKICNNKSFYFKLSILGVKDSPLIKPQNILLENNLKISFNCELYGIFLNCDCPCLQSRKQNEPYNPYVPEAVDCVRHWWNSICIFNLRKIMMQFLVLSHVKTKTQERSVRNPLFRMQKRYLYYLASFLAKNICYILCQNKYIFIL